MGQVPRETNQRSACASYSFRLVLAIAFGFAETTPERIVGLSRYGKYAWVAHKLVSGLLYADVCYQYHAENSCSAFVHH